MPLPSSSFMLAQQRKRVKRLTKNGIDRLRTEDFGLEGLKLGLITSPTGVCRDLTSSIDALHKAYDLRALYSPEHGVRGDIAAGGTVEPYTDERTGLPVYSLYGGDNRPQPEMLENIDALLIDVQDIGCRYYTYISTMRNSMEVCAKLGKAFVVLDRPNPIGGVAVEGNILETAFTSFVGIAPIPQRHGLTIGELALFFNMEYSIGCNLTVIPMDGWSRHQCFDQTDLLWVNPSPNMPGMDAALLYPGTCFFEGTNLSEGRGTTKPFEMIGAPWLNAEKLADTLNAKQLPGVLFRPVYFRPSASKHQNVLCGGVQAHITCRETLDSIATGLTMLALMAEMSGSQFQWLPPNREKGSYFIDLLAGTDTLRKTMDIPAYLNQCHKDSEAFTQLRKPYLLYN